MTSAIRDMSTDTMRLARLPDASAQVGCEYLVAWRLATSGKIFSIRRGRALLVDVDQLAAAIKRKAGA
jgi:hypothetical protein